MATSAHHASVGDKLVSRVLAAFAAALGGACAFPLYAASVPKADNAEALSLPASWADGVLPGISDVAVFDSRLTQPGPFSLGASLAWAGLGIEDPAADIVFAPGSTLSLGSAGIDLSLATRSLAIQGPVQLSASQTWRLAAARTLSVGEALTRANGVTLDVASVEAGGVTLAAATPGALLLGSTSAYATLNKNDFAGVNSAGVLVPGAAILAYVPNPATGLPTMAGTINGVLDVVNSGTYGVRLGNNLTVTNGVRFAVPHATADRWQIDAPSGRGFTVGAILIAPELGADRVIMTGTGFLRGSNNQAAGGLIVHQHNPAADFEVAVGIINYSSSFTPLTKTGSGTLLLSAACYYTGPTYVQDGTLLVRADNSAATGPLSVHAPAVLGGTGIIGGATTILPGAVLASEALTFKGPLTLQGDTVVQIDGTAQRGADYDAITVAPTGSLAYGGRLALSVNQVLAPGDYTLNLFAFSGTPTGSFASVEIGGVYQLALVNTGGVWTGATGGVTFSYSEATGELTVNVPVTQTNGTLILISENQTPPRPRPSSPLVLAQRFSVQS